MVQSQEINSLTIPNRIYIELGLGVSNSSYRDFATSPLFYRGVPLAAKIFRTEISEQRETRLGMILQGGFFQSEVNGYAINNSFASSVFFDAHHLRIIKKWSNEKWNTKVGGKFNTVLNYRNNPVLRNNAYGFEVISTLYGSIKISRDISRQKRKKGRFSFINYSLPPRARKLSYMLNIGIVNSSYRNGYIYTNPSSVLNDFDPFSEYDFNLFSGFRFGSTVNYIQSLKNKNSIMVSYTWDVARTKGDFDNFEMVNHLLTFSLLFSTR